MKERNPHALRGVACAALGGVCWGFSGTCGQYLFSRFEVSSLWLTCVRLLAGVYLLATGGDPRHMALSPKGLFWGLAAAVAVALYTLLPQSLLSRWERDAVIGPGMLIGGVFLNLTARSWTFSVSLPLQGWLAVGAIVLLGTAVAFSLIMQGIVDVGPAKASMLASTEPVSATVFSALWLGTSFSVTDLIGFAAITATVFLLAKSE